MPDFVKHGTKSMIMSRAVEMTHKDPKRGEISLPDISHPQVILFSLRKAIKIDLNLLFSSVSNNKTFGVVRSNLSL